MIRRLFFWGSGLALMGFLVFGSHAASYIGTAVGWVKDSVKQSVPVEFEIERARGMVKNIMPEIRKNMQIIAKEEVEVERLEHEIAGLDRKQDKDRTELMKLRAEAGSGKEKFRFAGRSYTIDQVKVDLANRFERFKTTDATVGSLREILAARQTSLEAARQKLEGMLAAKRQLEVDVENLEARLKMVEVAQTASDYCFDDSHLGRVKELISDLRTRLTVEEKMVHAEGTLHDEIPVAQPATDDILERVTEYFETPAESVAPAKGSEQPVSSTAVAAALK